MRVIKRNKSIDQYDSNKVKRSMLMAFDAADVRPPDVGPLMHQVNEYLLQLDKTDFSVEDIAACVEQILINSGHTQVARVYMKYRMERDQHQWLQPVPLIADYIHASKYARYNGTRRETYFETVDRVRQMHLDRWPHLYSDINAAFAFVREKMVLPSMRSMQFAGDAIQKQNARMFNCSFTLIDRPRVFGDIMYLLLCGCGVGYSVQWKHINNLPPLKTLKGVKHHSIIDSIEGWGLAINELIQSFLDGYWIEFDYSQIRDEGSPLITSGGKAPGHLPLRNCIETIRGKLLGAGARKLRPIEWHDIICHLAEAVLSGGVRRSSLMCLFSDDDTEMLYAKSSGCFEWNGLNAQRAMANNSVVIADDNREIFNRVMEINGVYGEPGFYFTRNRDHGCNPCAEIGLNPVADDGTTTFGFCNLTEINCARAMPEWRDACWAASFIGTLQASYTDFGFGIDPSVAERDALLGVSLTGIMDRMPTRDELREGVEIVRQTNQLTASRIGIRHAKRLTTIKPSGTASLELGCIGSGIHPHHSPKYFRTVTANANEPPAQYFAKCNPHMVSLKPNGDLAIKFPIEAPANATFVESLAFLILVQHFYDYWVLPGTVEDDDGLTHNVSATCTVLPTEVEEVTKFVYDNKMKAVSFVPKMFDENVPFIPRKTVTDEDLHEWNKLIRLAKHINWKNFNESEDSTNLEQTIACAGGSCEI